MVHVCVCPLPKAKRQGIGNYFHVVSLVGQVGIVLASPSFCVHLSWSVSSFLPFNCRLALLPLILTCYLVSLLKFVLFLMASIIEFLVYLSVAVITKEKRVSKHAFIPKW